MNGSPRASKRRKLEPPKEIASSPLAKGAFKKVSSRLATRSTSLANGYSKEEQSTPASKLRSSRSHGALSAARKRAVEEELDIYDDIEGALGEPSPAPSSIQSFASKSRRSASAALRTNGARTPKAQGPVSKKNGAKKQPIDLELEIQDELAAEVSTPRKRAASGNATGVPSTVRVVKTRTSGRPTRRIAESPTKEISGDELQENEKNGSPSKARSARRNAYSTKTQKQAVDRTDEDTPATPSRASKRRVALHKSTVEDSEDELGFRGPPSGARNAKSRRRANRADHMSNEDDIIIESEDEQAGASAQEEEAEESEANGHSASVDGGSILDPTEPSPFNPLRASKQKEAPISLSGNIRSGRELDLLKYIVMERLIGKRLTPLVGLDEEYQSVHQIVEHTIAAGEGNSMLVIGARGSGKTALVNKVLLEISKDNSQDYHVVRLNGFIHTDDKIALREIWRQLGKEMDIEEDGGLGKNYADTLATLLALLSHPSEQTGEETEHVAKAVIFVMDEFDLFAQHPRQTLLYNLFDIAQSRKAPIVVLGLTTRIDVANSLEKRVKSRFSHRYVHLSLAKTFTAFQEICKACLLVEPDQLNVEERAILSTTLTTTPRQKDKKGAKHDILTEWNANITSLFNSKVFITNHLAPEFYLTKSVPAVLTSFLITTANLSETTPSVHPALAVSLGPPDSRLHLIPSLSALALSLLIAAARLDIIHDSDTVNFNMAYDEYVTLSSKARIQSAAGGNSVGGGLSKVWGKEVARREWEGLLELGLVVPVLSGGAGGGFAMVRCDVSLEEIGVVVGREKGIEKGLERWCRQL
ncbi:P-loop containing nucleoside triphosphate hydrolase protein [Amniculicola lignicola CBS 123094]|uniref:Origin recognition complex subunit 4 n=1 Tax=Amniculicola lignicola CBS 123094 TaxID=1392246 RepID=A0A6A5WL20_9PLEO|nr:P-loop containing nucleoside triphosphate hydrolase protein [Amniculicola lignicola CBS 123094]